MVVAAKAIETFLEKLPPYMPAFKGVNRAELDRSIYNSTGYPFQPHDDLLPHQVEGIAFALYARRALLFFQPRMRKTSIALHWAEHLRRAKLWTNKGLVIAHSPDGLDVWRNEAALRSGLKVKIVHLNMDDFIDGLEDDSDLIVIPWSGLQEMFSVAGTRRKGDKVENKLLANVHLLEELATNFGLCIIDEIHMCMHHTSLRFAIASVLTSLCKFRLGLTGTPFGRDPYALWSQAFLIDRGETLGWNYYFFEQAFGKGKTNYWSGRMEYKFDKDKMPLLERKMSAITMAYERSEVAEQTVWDNIVELHMWGDQLAAYRDVVERFVQLESDSVEIQNTFHRLRQVSSGYLPFEDKHGKKHVVHFKSNPKLEWLSDFAQHAPTDVQVIIFHHYVHTGELICKVLERHQVKHGWLYGGTRGSREVIRAFQAGETHVLVANANKGGMSIDLRMADYVCFFESPVSPITRRQAQDRPMARGDRELMIDTLVCSGVERRIMDFLKEGTDLMRSLTSVRTRRSFAEPGTAPVAARKGRKALPAATLP